MAAKSGTRLDYVAIGSTRPPAGGTDRRDHAAAHGAVDGGNFLPAEMMFDVGYFPPNTPHG